MSRVASLGRTRVQGSFYSCRGGLTFALFVDKGKGTVLRQADLSLVSAAFALPMRKGWHILVVNNEKMYHSVQVFEAG